MAQDIKALYQTASVVISWHPNRFISDQYMSIHVVSCTDFNAVFIVPKICTTRRKTEFYIATIPHTRMIFSDE